MSVSQAWREAVQQLSLQLADEAVVAALVQSGTRLRALDGQTEPTPAALAEITATSFLVGAYAYDQAPRTFASDLAADMQGATAIPAEDRQALIPATAEALERADATATGWLAEVLGLPAEPAAPSHVAVIVLWQPHSAGSGQPACVFVLLKATRFDAQGRPHVAELIFGNPLAPSPS